MDEDRTEARDALVDRRASDLGLQLEQVNVTLQQLRQTHDSLHDMETQLADMTRECAGILDRWAKNDEKHAAAVVELHSRLSEWNDIERRLLTESATRVHQFERSLQHEWNGLKQRHEGPLQQLEAQSTRIAETCLTAVDQALRGFDRAEARITALEQEMQRQMGDLSHEVRGALAELRQGQAPLAARPAWSLDNVVRLHNELRADADGAPGGDEAPGGGTGTLGLAAARAPRVIEASSGADTRGDQSVDAEGQADLQPGASRNGWGLWRMFAGVVLVGAVAGYGFYLRGQLSDGLRVAANRAETAERDAAASRDLARREIAAVRQASDERLASAEQNASAAQMLAALVASPDVKRFSLRTSTDRTPVAHVLWSRTQGLALSAARLPTPPAGRTYQLWLITRTEPASVGVFAANPTGPTNVVFAWPPDLRRAVIGASVTTEPATGSRQPTETPWLVSSVADPGAAP